ncbi:sulfite exporter TauE/SafE family protein [Desulfohalovibrio reitneri]|uniref:sulfite exporter TauE/SafE family protein n=1 Tax=Desulfohalovibrio reitneri TaxID=1307759 RepID=UPI0006906893|nr:sulfite exporter TauE/SafE family protein [Desulfohalovibrio reitneri]
MSKLTKSPYLEITIMVGVLVISFIGMGILTTGMETPGGGMEGSTIFWILLGSFILSFGIALLAVMGGIGGGVLFTPIMLAFTAVDSLIVRATGLIVAMFSGLISTGPFMRRGLANLKICILAATCYGIGAFGGAQGAILVAEHMGPEGEGAVRLALGFIIFMLAIYFLVGGKKIEYPEVHKVDKFTEKLDLTQPYYEASEGKVCEYKVTRAALMGVAVTGVGLLSGFFGLGAGWAIVPALNIIMAVPLKVAAACSGVLLGMGDCVALWPYLLSGAIIPLFAAPWLVGQVLGGLVGAYILMRVKAGFIRILLIGIMFFSAYGLLTKGLNMMNVIANQPPNSVTFSVLGVIVTAVVLILTGVLPGYKSK